MSAPAVSVADRFAPAVLWRRFKQSLYRDYCHAAGRRYLELRPDDVLVDVGGGGAYYMGRLAPAVRHAILVDRFEGMYESSRELARQARAAHPFSLVSADAHVLPFRNGSVTKVFSNQVLEHLDDPARFLAEIGRVLRPGGRAVVISQNARFLGRYGFPGRRVLHRLLPARWQEGNCFLSGGYEAWERAVGHLHRFTREGYAAMASHAGLDVVGIEAVHHRLSMALWEWEAASMHHPTAGLWVRVVSRGGLQPITRAIERLTGRDGLDLIGVFRKPGHREEGSA